MWPSKQQQKINITFSDFSEPLSWEQAHQNSSLKVTASAGHKPLKIEGFRGKASAQPGT